MARVRKFNQLVVMKGKQYRVIGKGWKRGTYDLATLYKGHTLIEKNISGRSIRKSRSKGKGRGWHGDAEGHAAAARKRSGVKKVKKLTKKREFRPLIARYTHEKPGW